MSHLFVKPSRPGLKVHLENKPGFLPDDGQEVEQTIYWVRRLKDGSVVEYKPTRSSRQTLSGTDSAPKSDKTSNKE
ncbi:DUF2635 domain-containing protein [Thiohalophilus sp.]|uniref:DUF2635 domain-containing protein n=1 Tax=Thiohalophilus sp. TaxID=3028392 RepID=UPI002ACD8245|nr:DUF2635 domain-containing protein [Thiohalophilus sp.]MDZ7804336.1 DUF2635 domain-containing protein [Thiohalophilus sp.]